MTDYPPCRRVGCGHTAWAHGTQTGHPHPDEPCHAVTKRDDGLHAACPCHGYVRDVPADEEGSP